MYDFKCSECEVTTEFFLHMNDVRPTVCPSCNKSTLYRIFSKIAAIIDNNSPKTLGELADRNTERMVKQGKIPKSHLEYESRKKKIKAAKDRTKKIGTLSKAQADRYINTGEL